MVSMPRSAAMACAVASASPVIMATFSPIACSASMAAGVEDLILSATTISAATCPSIAAKSGV
jgi:hypothetical protein